MTRGRRDAGGGRGLSPGWLDAATWAVALLLALGLWLFVNAGARTSERILRARLDLVHLPAGMVVTNAVPDQVEIRAMGSGLLLSSIDAKRLGATLDLSGVRPGVATFTLSGRHFALPRNVEVTRITPSEVSLDVDRVSRRVLPVVLDTEGRLATNLRLAEVRTEPDKLAVTGPRSQLSEVEHISTRAVDLAGLPAGVHELEVELVRPGGLLRLRRATVTARLVVRPEPDTLALEPGGDRSDSPGAQVRDPSPEERRQ